MWQGGAGPRPDRLCSVGSREQGAAALPAAGPSPAWGSPTMREVEPKDQQLMVSVAHASGSLRAVSRGGLLPVCGESDPPLPHLTASFRHAHTPLPSGFPGNWGPAAGPLDGTPTRPGKTCVPGDQGLSPSDHWVSWGQGLSRSL